jgi:hypothetical protein
MKGARIVTGRVFVSQHFSSGTRNVTSKVFLVNILLIDGPDRLITRRVGESEPL